MRRSLVLVSFLGLALPVVLPAAARAAPAPELELQIRWGEIKRATPVESRLDDLALAPPGSLEVRANAARATDVTQVLRYQPLELRGGERPYDPSIRIPDHVATGLVAAGGVAIITSVIVEWLR
jgi:hypothetical protein